MSTLSQIDKTSQFISKLDSPENEFQKNSLEKLKTLEFPSTKDEYWKYTRIGKISGQIFSQKSESAERINLNEYIVANDYLVVENGIVREDISQFKKLNFDVEMYSADQIVKNPIFNQNIDSENIFHQINASFFDKVISLKFEDKKINEGPLQIIYVGSGENTISNTRLLIEAGKFSENEIIETFVSIEGENCFTNHITEVYLRENSKLSIHKVQYEGETCSHMSTEQVYQEQNSNFKINTITLSGLLVRNNINILVDGQNCETAMNGAIISKGKQHVDNHTFVDHLVSNCESNENYKYVLDGNSTGVFNGRVVVEKDAQIINAFQNNGNILLSDTATINSKPELEIYADDVKCSHGSTTGQLDEDALFYLQSRGIDLEKAKKLLVSAFINEIIEEFVNQNLIELISGLLIKEHNWEE